VIEETITIDAGTRTVWELFVDLSRWSLWNRTLTNVSSGEARRIEQGKPFTCLMRPLVCQVRLEPLAEEVLPSRRIILTGHRFGIRARHEFLFEGNETQTKVTSRETFRGILPGLPGWFFLRRRLEKLTVCMLRDLKAAAEMATPKVVT
jgi:hypothetical protein